MGRLSDATVLAALKRLGNYRVEVAQRVALEGPPDDISGSLLLALGLRESGLQNINNPAESDHGVFQISENYHTTFLHEEPGCKVGTWVAVPGRWASETGFCPRYTPALNYALRMLQSGQRQAKHQGVSKDDRLRVAVAAYNGGMGGAMGGYRKGNPDLYTTGGDYSAWVLAHRTVINRVLAKSLPNWVVKEPE